MWSIGKNVIGYCIEYCKGNYEILSAGKTVGHESEHSRRNKGTKFGLLCVTEGL